MARAIDVVQVKAEIAAENWLSLLKMGAFC